MFKIFPLNEDYSFNLDGDFKYKDVLHTCSKPNTDIIEIVINGLAYNLAYRWLSLISHYEVNLPYSELMKISFEECKSKVIGLKCGYLMVFNGKIRVGDDDYVIPGFTRFSTNKAGIVKSIKSNRILKPSIGPYGYPYVNVYDADKNNWRSVNLHILLARTFIKNPDPSTKFFVNHKDGDKLNFNLKNLEWVTSLENQRHAVDSGLRNDNKPCKVMDIVTKEVANYTSIGLALTSLGLKSRDVRIAKRVNGVLIPSLILGRYEIKLLNDESNWFYTSEDKLKMKVRTTSPFEAKHIASDQIIESPTIRGLSSKVQMSSTRIEDNLKSFEPIAINGYLFRVKTSDPWPLTWKESTFVKPRKIKLTDTDTGEVKIFSSIRQAISFLGIDKRTLKNRLNNGSSHGKWVIEEIS